MMKPVKLAIRVSGMLTALLVLLPLTFKAAPPVDMPAKLSGAHRVVFLGDSITYASHYVEDIEAYFDTRFPKQPIEWINVGLSSETVSGLTEAGHAGGKYPRPDVHERLARVLEKAKPDLLFVCYGMNDGIYQTFDPERFSKFQDGMKWLHEQVTAAHVKIVHLTPTVFDPSPIKAKLSQDGGGGFSHPSASYNEVLDRYSAWLVDQHKSAGWEVVDVHSAMNRWLAERRKQNPDFNFTKDGVHPDEAGHWVIAKEILKFLGAGDLENASNPAAMVSGNPHGAEILKQVHQKQELLRDAWLSEIGHKRPGVKPGLPLAEAEAKAAAIDKQIRDLTNGN